MIIDFIAAFLSAVLGSMGLGGGSILVIYLTLFRGLEQTTAQGTNLLFFIPCAVISILLLNKSKFIKWKSAFILIAGGLVGVGIGFFALPYFQSALLQKIFAVFLLIIGAKELFNRN